MKEFDEIELKIKESLEKVVKEAYEAGGLNTGEWTKRIKSEFCKLGHDKGFSVSASGCDDAETGEWLFDLIWSDGEGDPWVFREIPLAMECEWYLYDEDIWWDFQKLLGARAKNRIFIFNKKTNYEINNLMNQLQDAIHNFKSTQIGDRYLLAGFSYEDDNFNFVSVVV